LPKKIVRGFHKELRKKNRSREKQEKGKRKGPEETNAEGRSIKEIERPKEKGKCRRKKV